MDKRKVTFGLILIVIGFLLLIRTLGIVYFDFGDFVGTLIPLGLIVVGAWLIIRKKREQDRMTEHFNSYSQASTATSGPAAGAQRATGSARAETHSQTFDGKTAQGPSVSREGFQQYRKALGDLFVDLAGVNMRNIEVSSFVGDIEIIASRAELGEGLNRLIISDFLGDVRVFVPRDWQVFVHANSFAGDMDVLGRRSDGLGNTLEVATDDYEGAEKKLYIAISGFVGDMKVLQV